MKKVNQIFRCPLSGQNSFHDIDDSREYHYQNWAQLCFAQQQQAACKKQQHRPICLGKRHRPPIPESIYQKQHTGEPSKLCADEGRRVHRDRTGRHFRNGHKICKFLYAQPAVPGNKLLLKKRHHRVAAEAEQADLQKTQKKLQCDHLRFLLRASSVRTIPSTIQQRIM
mgnify:CR=1 FL=1